MPILKPILKMILKMILITYSEFIEHNSEQQYSKQLGSFLATVFIRNYHGWCKFTNPTR